MHRRLSIHLIRRLRLPQCVNLLLEIFKTITTTAAAMMKVDPRSLLLRSSTMETVTPGVHSGEEVGVALITTIMGTAAIMTARIMTGTINVVLEVEMAACSTTGLRRQGIFIDLRLFLLCLLAPRPFGLMGIIWATLVSCVSCGL